MHLDFFWSTLFASMSHQPKAKKARKDNVEGSEAPKAKGEAKGGMRSAHAPTVREILSDELTALSLQHWASKEKAENFDAALVEQLFRTELLPALAPVASKAVVSGSTEEGAGSTQAEGGALSRLMLLELSRYLEKCALLSPSLNLVLSLLSPLTHFPSPYISPWCFAWCTSFVPHHRSCFSSPPSRSQISLAPF